MIRDIHLLTMVHIINTILHGRITRVVSGSVFGIAFLNFESTRLVLLCVDAAF